jgi:integration host factor subunit beta
MSTITEKELIHRIAARTQAKRVLVKATVQSFIDALIAELAKGNRLEFRDFRVLETKARSARTTQNPKTLERVQVPAKQAVKFKAGRLMKQKLNGRKVKA